VNEKTWTTLISRSDQAPNSHWSPDGKKVAYLKRDEGGTPLFTLYDVVIKQEIPLTKIKNIRRIVGWLNDNFILCENAGAYISYCVIVIDDRRPQPFYFGKHLKFKYKALSPNAVKTLLVVKSE